MKVARYDWSGGSEAMLRFGPNTGPIVIAALPSFEEANRTRSFIVSILRALAERGIGSILPDLPGTGESRVPLEGMTLAGWRSAYKDLAKSIGGDAGGVYGLGIRSGALLDSEGALAGRWHLAPQDGPALVRELTRVKQADPDREGVLAKDWYRSDHLDELNGKLLEIGGNFISPALLASLADDPVRAWEHPVRVARLLSDPKPADIRFDAAPLWRRSEPDNNIDLAQLVADDIELWISSCGR